MKDFDCKVSMIGHIFKSTLNQINLHNLILEKELLKKKININLDIYLFLILKKFVFYNNKFKIKLNLNLNLIKIFYTYRLAKFKA
jgi:hypothetical protein